MKGIQPHEIPQDGERYDMTLDRIGYDDVKSESPKIVVKFIIDNGVYKGKRVSHIFAFGESVVDSWVDFQRALGVLHGPVSSKRAYLAPFLKQCKIARLSAIVHVDKEVTEAKDIVKYRLSDFEPARADAQMRLVRAQTRFQRC